MTSSSASIWTIARVLLGLTVRMYASIPLLTFLCTQRDHC